MVRKDSKIVGMPEVMKNLNAEIKAIKGRTMKGMYEAVAFIRTDMDKKEPLIPIGRTGYLRKSWFTTALKTLRLIGLIMGFSANYAIFVHEMVDKSNKKINWSRPGSGAKFFQSAISRNKDEILKIIAKNAQIK